MGITAEDVARFLQQHAHPQVARRVPAVPEVSRRDSPRCNSFHSLRRLFSANVRANFGTGCGLRGAGHQVEHCR